MGGIVGESLCKLGKGSDDLCTTIDKPSYQGDRLMHSGAVSCDGSAPCVPLDATLSPFSQWGTRTRVMKGREPVHACARLCKAPKWTDVHAWASLVHPRDSHSQRDAGGCACMRVPGVLVPGPVRVSSCASTVCVSRVTLIDWRRVNGRHIMASLSLPPPTHHELERYNDVASSFGVRLASC